MILMPLATSRRATSATAINGPADIRWIVQSAFAPCNHSRGCPADTKPRATKSLNSAALRPTVALNVAVAVATLAPVHEFCGLQRAGRRGGRVGVPDLPGDQ